MATFEQNLEAIENARYGKDVRDALHDAIEETYDKVTTLSDAVREQVGDLGFSLNGVNDDVISSADMFSYSQGGIKTSNGSDSTSTTRIRIPKYIPVTRYKYIEVANGYKCMIFIYTGTTYSTFQGVYDGSTVGSSGVWLTGRIYLNLTNYYFRIVVATSADADITPSAFDKAKFVSYGQIKPNVECLVKRKSIIFTMTNGQEINPLTGGNREASNRARSDYMYSPFSKLEVSFPSNILYRLFEYEDNTYTTYTLVTTDWMSGDHTVPAKPNHYYRLEMKKSDESAIDLNDVYSNGAIDIYSPDDEQNWLSGFQLDISDEFVWSRGSIKSDDGTSTTMNQARRCRTKLALINLTYTVQIPVDKTLVLYLYANNETSSYISNVPFVGTGNIVALKDTFALYPTAKFMRFVGMYTNDLNIDEIGAFVSEIKIYGVQNVIHDTVETQGAINVVKRTHQLTDIQYTPVADLPAQESQYQADNYKIIAGTECVGMKYSSVRIEQLYVPQAVSFDTFMTALANPNSYLYTRESTVPNSKTYYGAVCSTFVAYAYGIDDVIPTTISFTNYEGFNELPDYMQNPNSLKIGYMLNHAGSHIAIVTDIIRDFKGKILLIEVSDAWHPFMRRRMLTPAQIQQSYFNADFVAYKYEYIDSVPYTASPWVVVDDEEHVDIAPNPNLSPRRGDKANWRPSENVVIDITDAGTYTSYVVTNRDTDSVISSQNSLSTPITLTNLSSGRYAVHLTSGSSNSDSVEFNVMDTNEQYETIEDGVIRVTYHTDLGTPSAIIFCNNNPSCYDYRAVRYFHVLSASEIVAGQATVNKPPVSELEYQDEEYEAPNGVWEMRVMYKTEFGLYTSDGAQVNVYTNIGGDS